MPRSQHNRSWSLALLVAATQAQCTTAALTADDASSDASDDRSAATEAPAIGTFHPELYAPGRQPTNIVEQCQDGDNDGFGENCQRGADCNDFDRNVTNECYRCATPATGCSCSEEGATEACNVETDSTTVGTTGVCHSGTRLCTGGRWQRCMPNQFSTRTIIGPTGCGGACNPECRQTIICPTLAGELTGRGSGVVIAGAALPGFCPPGTGGIQLPGSGRPPAMGCATTCGGECCAPGQTCYTNTDSVVSPPFCTMLGGSVPPPIVTQVCGAACTATQTHCGVAPNDDCCDAGEVCRFGRCVASPGACTSDANCPAGFYCERGLDPARCVPRTTSNCNCEADAQQQLCLRSITSTGGRVINGIFRTRTGDDARTLRFARYIGGLETNPTGCVGGRSNAAAGGTYPCPGCTPVQCTSYACFSPPRTVASIGQFADQLDWLWTQHLRLNPWGGTAGDGRPLAGESTLDWGYDPREGRKYDLGAPANRVVLFPITDHTDDSCMEPFEYTVWLSDNPNATSIAPTNAPDPNQWNLAVLTETYTQGWTRNPNAVGLPSDTNNLESTAFGNAVADGMATVWALPCGYSFRYASIVAGNVGTPSNACQFHSGDDELDAVAGLTVEGNSLSIYHELPYGTGAGPDGLNFSTRLRTADVYFLFDTTGSMGGELSNLQSAMTNGTFVTGCSGGIVGAIKCIIPDAWFGVGRHDDFPVSPYGWSPSGDVVYENRSDLSADPMTAQTAINGIGLHNGNDWPESQTPALWATVTGRGLNGYFGSRTNCPAGRWGYPCFRPGTIPIVMLFTDAPFHNGAGGTNAYADNALFAGGSAGGTLGTQRGPTFAETVAEFNARGAKVIIVDSSGNNATARADFNAFAAGTNSVVSGGANAVYAVATNGTGLGTAVVNAVSDLANYSRMDVTAVALDNPATAIDERCFVRDIPGAPIGTIRLSNPAAGESAPYAAGRCVDPPTAVGGTPITARQCLPGTQVNFRAEFFNDCVMATSMPQTFTFDILVRGNGTYELGRVPVTIVVPENAFPATGTFTYDIDALTVCGAGRQARWTQLQFVGDTPSGTNIVIDAFTANTLAGLAAAPRVGLGTHPPATSPIDLSGALITAMQPDRAAFLRVRFTLNSNASRSATPTLRGYRVLFDCIDGS
ncbi:MAG: hypothetical protein JNK05_13145 [Myxococcales bacterium]|nr:hypothetical protein [Myxococcales bacterium]